MVGADHGDTWLRSKDGRTLLVAVRLKGTDKERKQAAPGVVAARSAAPGLRLEPSGEVWANREIDETIERDLSRAEPLTAPVLFLARSGILSPEIYYKDIALPFVRMLGALDITEVTPAGQHAQEKIAAHMEEAAERAGRYRALGERLKRLATA